MKTIKKNFWESFQWITMTILILILVLLTKEFIFSTTIVDGVSMEPTLSTNERLLVNKIGFKISDLSYGDIVEFKNPYNEDDYDYIKRIIALEGDIVEIIDYNIYINGEKIKENYIKEKESTSFFNDSYWEIGTDEIFVLGDNRNRSQDSRIFGPINKTSIVGIASYRLLPLKKFGKI